MTHIMGIDVEDLVDDKLISKKKVLLYINRMRTSSFCTIESKDQMDALYDSIKEDL